MKVLLCTPYDFSGKTPGGISVWAKNIIDYQENHADNDIHIDIFSFTRSRYINENTSKIKRILYGIYDYIGFIIKINNIVKKNNYNIVHITTTASLGTIKDIVLCYLLKKNNVKVFLHYHFGRIPTLAKIKNWEWYLICRSIKLSYKSIVMDHNSYLTLKNNNIVNICEIPNPYSPELDKQVENFEGKIKRIGHRILFIGRVFRQKGIYELVQACTKISNIELRIIGPYEEVDKQNLLNIANNGDWIQFIGPIAHENVIKELMAADIFVMPTYTEGFPNAVLECMISKTPIIVTPVGAIPEMLDFDNDPCGVKIRIKNVDDIVDAISSLINNMKKKIELTDRAYKRVKEKYNINIVVKMLFDLWKE